jgi:hypothetical protein
MGAVHMAAELAKYRADLLAQNPEDFQCDGERPEVSSFQMTRDMLMRCKTVVQACPRLRIFAGLFGHLARVVVGPTPQSTR